MFDNANLDEILYRIYNKVKLPQFVSVVSTNIVTNEMVKSLQVYRINK